MFQLKKTGQIESFCAIENIIKATSTLLGKIDENGANCSEKMAQFLSESFQISEIRTRAAYAVKESA